jgi:hypothetical protein
LKQNTYALTSRLSAETAIARIGELLAKEGVKYRIEGLSLFSISTPIALFSFQRILYTKKNWVGVNPFTYISGVNVRCHPDESGVTQIIIEVNKFRTFAYVAIWVCSSGMASAGMPTLTDAILFIVMSSVAAWFVLVAFLGGYLVKKEIANCLNA